MQRRDKRGSKEQMRPKHVMVVVAATAAMALLQGGCGVGNGGVSGVWIDNLDEDLFEARLELSADGRFELHTGVSEYVPEFVDRSGSFEESDHTIVLDPDESSGRIVLIFDSGSDTLRLAPSTDEDLEFGAFLKDLGMKELVLVRER